MTLLLKYHSDSKAFWISRLETYACVSVQVRALVQSNLSGHLLLVWVYAGYANCAVMHAYRNASELYT
jgi:hypothetical protein